MALMFPWATKEYLLWEMSIGQIIMYFNLGSKRLNPEDPEKKDSLIGKSYDELKELRDQMRVDGLLPSKE